MIGGTPALATLSRPTTDDAASDLLTFFDRFGVGPPWYGSGKAAFRDLLAASGTSDGTVLIPAYLPDAVAEPITDLGLEPVYYAVRSDLGPDLSHLDALLDDRTVAVLSVDYFGFPQPAHDRIATRTAEYGCLHVEDNAHAPISVADGELLGTRGDCGFTSLWKLLPVPNGALVSLNDPTLAQEFEPSEVAGARDRLTVDDVRYLGTSLATTMLERHRAVKRSVEALRSSRGVDADHTAARARYERSLRPMSKLTHRALQTTEPGPIRDARRANFRAWDRFVESSPDLRPMYDRLPAGICPQVYPVRVDDSDALLSHLRARDVVGAHTWPRLPPTVRTDPTYETARTLAEEVVVLPVHQHLDPADVDALEPIRGF